MDFNEAQKALRAVGHFFRALKVIEDVLDEAENARISLIQVKEEERAARNFIDGAQGEIARAKDDLKRVKDKLAEKLAEVDAKVAAKENSLLADLESAIDAKQKELSELEASLKDAEDLHQSRMKDYADAENMTNVKARDAQAKLDKIERAYEALKAKLT